VRCTDPSVCAEDALTTVLEPLAPNIAWLDMGCTQVGDAFLGTVAGLPHLTRLHLERLENLRDLAYLEYLNLYGTSVSDSGLHHLSSLSTLQSLYLWQTNVTEEGAENLQQSLPDLEVNLGLHLTPVDISSTEE